MNSLDTISIDYKYIVFIINAISNWNKDDILSQVNLYYPKYLQLEYQCQNNNNALTLIKEKPWL